MVWADPHSGYQDRWCVTCGHLSAGTDSPDLSLRMSRVGNELRVLCWSREPIGSLDLLVRDECRGEDIVLATLHGVGGELAADLALRSLPSEDAVTVHVLRHRAGGLHSYRARSAGLTVARSFRLA
jgi:hypothetical protein